jgi:hypothetical protein
MIDRILANALKSVMSGSLLVWVPLNLLEACERIPPLLHSGQTFSRLSRNENVTTFRDSKKSSSQGTSRSETQARPKKNHG